MDFCLGYNWMCTQDSTCRFPWENMRWTQVRRYGVIFGWKFQIYLGLVIWTGPRSETSQWVWDRGTQLSLCGELLVRIWIGDVVGWLVAQAIRCRFNWAFIKGVPRNIRQLPGRVMCELGDLLGLAEFRLLSYAKTKVVGSFLLRRPHWSIRWAVGYWP